MIKSALIIFSIFAATSAWANRVKLQNKEHVVTFQSFGDRQVMTLTGFVTNRISDIKRVIASIRPGKDLILQLNSGGGDTYRFAQMFSLIRSRLKGARLVTYVPPRGGCDSACIDLFLLGDLRLAASTARFGFHGALDEDDHLLPLEESISEYRDNGMNPQFLKKMIQQGVFDRARISYFTSFELFVNQVLDGLIDAPPKEMNYRRYRRASSFWCGEILAND